MPVRAILLDLDGTLLDDRAATAGGFRALFQAYADAIPQSDEAAALVRWRELVDEYWPRFESGELSFDEQRRQRVQSLFGRQLSDAETDRAVRVYVAGYEAYWRPLPGVVAFLERARHIPKAIVTNGERKSQLRKIAALGVSEHVAGIVTPGDCGHWKPSPEIFRAAFELLSVSANECLMIGDDPVRDIEPAARLGMRSVHVPPGASLEAFGRAVAEHLET